MSNPAIQTLKIKIAAMKAAPIFQKAAIAEQTMDALIAVLQYQQFEIEKLKGGQNGKG